MKLSTFTSHPLYRIVLFILRRSITVGLTIFFGLCLTVVVSNTNGALEESFARQISQEATRVFRNQPFDSPDRLSQQQIEDNLLDEAGFNDPFWLRQVRLAVRALTLDWGEVTYRQLRAQLPTSAQASSVNAIVLTALPNTLMLVGFASLIVFVIGLPLALNLSRRPGSTLDRFMSVLAPLSTFPSWVIGLVLVLIFAIQLRWFPASGMRTALPGRTELEVFLNTARFFVLPVTAVVISLFFQFVYTWRSYLISFAEEDYVELAKARGLPSGILERRHILRPSLSFIVTSFMLTLVSFWQMAIALEVVFQWPGIGLLYVESLPNFWSESMFPGDMVITVALVTTFAYLLGVTVILLEVFYALIDPRIRVDQPLRLRASRPVRASVPASVRKAARRGSTPSIGAQLAQWLRSLPAELRRSAAALWQVLSQFRKYPAALFGLVVIVMLMVGSLYAAVALPLNKIGLEWYSNSVTGRTYRPRVSMPSWLNWFGDKPYLSTIIMDSRDPASGVTKTVSTDANGNRVVTLLFEFDFPYREIPQEVFFYFQPDYSSKRPFILWTWRTPDGREVELVSMGDPGYLKISLADKVFSGPTSAARAVNTYPALAAIKPETMPLYYLFTNPEEANLQLVSGKYQLEMEAMLFEPDADLDAEFVMLGQVYGAAGTDGYRRDLLTPLVWGMPFALLFGMGAALLSMFVALALGAASVWYGGIVDWIAQRLSDLNMIMPVLAIGVLFYSFYGLSIWSVLFVIVLFSSFGSPVKTFRSAFLQVKESSYIESARSYGASDSRIIFKYMIPKIMPLLIPQLIYLIPTYIFLEATLGMFNIRMIYPTWGRIIYEALNSGLVYGSRFWVLQPLALVFLTGLAFSMVGFALDKILNPKLNV
ncbi:MAG TPA: ABC transporter permease subunit [Anaerolineales bacterium]|nr:ABC transporter permease subunit [Anaerolineales bacterium]HRQ91555.1 ABC transporter permease subunit [Anaerolineales bacterium]